MSLERYIRTQRRHLEQWRDIMEIPRDIAKFFHILLQRVLTLIDENNDDSSRS